MKIIAFDVGGTKIKAGIVEGKKVSDLIVEKTKARGSLEDFLGQISGIIDKLMSDDIEGIALGLPSQIDLKNDEIIKTTNIPALSEFGLRGYLEEVYNLPVATHNDTACFALGELYFGSAKERKSVISMTLGTGMGVAAINNGQIINLYGREDVEFSDRKFLDKTFEDYCSGKYFLDNFGKDSKVMQTLAEEGDKKALQAFANLGKHLKEALEILVVEHSPELIILGGSISNSFFIFKPELKGLEVKVVVSKTENVALLGASKLIKPKKIKNGKK